MKILVTPILRVVGLINLFPVIGVIAAERLAGLVSMLAFILLVYIAGNHGEAMSRIAVIEIAASAGLLFVPVLSRCVADETS